MDEGILEKALAIGANIVESNAGKYSIRRYLYSELELSTENKNHITVLAGLRGAGKTVLLSQLASGKKYSYLQMDYAPLKSLELYDLLSYLYRSKGSDLIILDEFQECMDFSSLKAFYEETKGEVSVVVSGSSAVALHRPPELARRTKNLFLQPLSFREYLLFKKGIKLPVLTFEEIREGKANSLLIHSPLIKDYMAESLPYMLGGDANVMDLIDKIIRHDLMVFRKLDYGNVTEIEKVLVSLALSKGETSYTSISNSIGVEKTQIMRYMSLLEEALVLKELLPEGAAGRVAAKERKIYFTPPFRSGILRELGAEPEVGIMREEFFVQHVFDSSLKYLWGEGRPDFSFMGKTFEVGGARKGKEQGADYLVVDGKVPGKGELPLVAFGFLY